MTLLTIDQAAVVKSTDNSGNSCNIGASPSPGHAISMFLTGDSQSPRLIFLLVIVQAVNSKFCFHLSEHNFRDETDALSVKENMHLRSGL